MGEGLEEVAEGTGVGPSDSTSRLPGPQWEEGETAVWAY